MTWMDKNHISSKVWDDITTPFLKSNGCTVVVLERIFYFVPYFIMDVIAKNKIITLLSLVSMPWAPLNKGSRALKPN